MKEECSSKLQEVYKKAGIFECIKRPVVGEEIERVMALLFQAEFAEESDCKFEIREFGPSMLLRIRGTIAEDKIPELINSIKEAANKGDSLIIDVSKVIKVHEHIKRVLIQFAGILLKSGKKLEIFDPKHKLTIFEIDETPNLFFI